MTVSGTSQITIKEAATILGVCLTTARKWFDMGLLGGGRHPVNGYRVADTDRVEALRDEIQNGLTKYRITKNATA